MAANKKPKPRKPDVAAQLAKAQASLALIETKNKIKDIRTAGKLHQDALSIYEAARRNRRNKDWKAPNVSADQAILPESEILMARARQQHRDSWIVRSVVGAYVRNIVGTEIRVVPNARTEDGKPLRKLNKVISAEYYRWARSKLCDVEGRQTWPQKQRLAVSERATVGEHMIGWSYRVPLRDPKDPTSDVDLSRPCGLQLQSFEPEQLDVRQFSSNGNEVRGGVEVGPNGEVIAYHIYIRNPNDYQYLNGQLQSRRIEKSRLFHYFKQERTLQTRGVTPLTPVMEDARDLKRHQEYTLWKVQMEACIGVCFTRQVPTLPGGGGNPYTNGGNYPQERPSITWEPGMVIEGAPGETTSPFNTNTPGSQYTPFQDSTLRAIAAGTGMSIGELTRSSDGNYSRARQDMLRDRQEWEPEQELFVDDVLRPMFEQFVHFCALEGRFDNVAEFDMSDFLRNAHRYVAAIYIPPPQPWIDPQKEAEAFSILLKNRLITREEIISLRGERYEEQVERLAAEQAEMEGEYNLSLPENEEMRKNIQSLVRVALGARLGTMDSITMNEIDMTALIAKAGIPGRAYKQTDVPIVEPPDPSNSSVIADSGEQQHNPDGTFGSSGSAGRKKVKDALPVISDGTGGAGRARGGSGSGGPTAGKKNGVSQNRALAVVSSDTGNVPDYRPCDDEAQSCGTCSAFTGGRLIGMGVDGGKCSMFNVLVEADHVCADWDATPIGTSPVMGGVKGFPPGTPDGLPDLDRRNWPDEHQEFWEGQGTVWPPEGE